MHACAGRTPDLLTAAHGFCAQSLMGGKGSGKKAAMKVVKEPAVLKAQGDKVKRTPQSAFDPCGRMLTVLVQLVTMLHPTCY